MNRASFVSTAFVAMGVCLAGISLAQSGNNNNGNSNDNGKILVCHHPPGNPSNAHTISISANAWPAHSANHPDDFLGACPVNNNNNNNNSNDNNNDNGNTNDNDNSTGNNNNTGNDNNNSVRFITVCHRPPGNPSNGQTITIPESAWAAHSANHPDDELGPCSNSNNNNNSSGNNNNTGNNNNSSGNNNNTGNNNNSSGNNNNTGSNNNSSGNNNNTGNNNNSSGNNNNNAGGNNNNNNTCTPSVTGFSLVSAGSSSVVGPFSGGDIDSICFFNIRAQVSCPQRVRSVEFILNGTTVRIENTAPYALGGDNSGIYHALALAAGSYQLEATPWTGPNASGTSGTSLTISFTVLDQGCVTTPPDTCTPAVTGFTLVRSGLGGDIGPFSGGDIDSVCRLNIRAEVSCPQNAGSVEFILNGDTYRIEVAAPYALGGDNLGKYHGLILTAGTYQLEAIPWTGPNATGTSGPGSTISFTVVDAGGCTRGNNNNNNNNTGNNNNNTSGNNNNNTGNNNNNTSGNNNNNTALIAVCHRPPGNPSNGQTIWIPQSAWAAHSANHPDDELGPCSNNNTNNNNTNGNNNNSTGNNNNNVTFITVCHRPPGNPSNGQTITIPESAWAAHSANHPDDELGPCSDNNNNSNGNGNSNDNGNSNGNSNDNNSNSNDNGNTNGNNNNNSNPRAPMKVLVCHHPPGNPTNTVEIYIAETAWPAHSANHPDDELGPCSNDNNNNNNGNKRSGTDEPESSEVEVFPNPAHGEFEVKLNLETAQSLTVKVFTSTGQLVFKDSKTSFSGTYSQKISLNNYPMGIYFVAVEMNDKIIVEKILCSPY